MVALKRKSEVLIFTGRLFESERFIRRLLQQQYFLQQKKALCPQPPLFKMLGR